MTALRKRRQRRTVFGGIAAMVLMIGATRIYRIIGDGGASIISRVMGLILASVATSNALAGIQAYFSL